MCKHSVRVKCSDCYRLIAHFLSDTGVIEWVTQKWFSRADIWYVYISRLPFTSALLYNNDFRDAKSSIFVKLQKSLHAQSNTIKCARKTIIILLTTKNGHTLPSVIHYWKSANTITYQRPMLLQLVGKKCSQSETKHNLETETRSFAMRI